MTRDEMHVLIAEKLEGWSRIPDMDFDDFFPWLDADGNSRMEPPNYSEDLNACARAEAKIAELDRGAEYADFLLAAIQFPNRTGRHCKTLDYDSEDVRDAAFAPARARVNAIVALIQDGAL
jgi:hypothetical protein